MNSTMTVQLQGLILGMSLLSATKGVGCIFRSSATAKVQPSLFAVQISFKVPFALLLHSWYLWSCSIKPEFGQMAGLAFFTTEKACEKPSPSECIRKPMMMAAARETPALQWTSTTPSFKKGGKSMFRKPLQSKIDFTAICSSAVGFLVFWSLIFERTSSTGEGSQNG